MTPRPAAVVFALLLTAAGLSGQAPKPDDTPKDPPIKGGFSGILARKAVVGQEFVYQLSVAGQPNATFKRNNSAPRTLTISESGLLRWTPTPEYGGKTASVSFSFRTTRSEGAGVRIQVLKADDPAAAPPQPADPVAVDAVLDKAAFFDLSKGAGLPAFMRSTPGTYADADGVRWGESRTTVPDLIEKDFTFDVLYKFREGEKSIARVGFTASPIGTPGFRESVCSHVHGPGHGGMASFFVTGKPEGQLGVVKTPGPHLFRVFKRGDVLTVAVGEWKDGTFRPYHEKSVSALKAAAPFLDKSSALFFSDDTSVHGVRLSVGGKVIDPGKPAPPPADVSKVPFVRLGGANPLPAFLKAEGLGTSNANGLLLHGVSFRTTETLLDKDFLIDFQFRFADGERGLILAGFGACDIPRGSRLVKDSVFSWINGEANGGAATIAASGVGDHAIGRYKSGGSKLYRIEKRGDTLTMTLGTVKDGVAEPFATRTIPRLSEAAPFLNRQNAAVFIGDGSISGGGTLEAVRFVVNGKPVPAGVAAVAANPAAPPAGKPADAPAGNPLDKAAFFDLSKGAGLPVYMRPNAALLGTEEGAYGANGGEARTTVPDLGGKDFTFDVLYKFREGEREIAQVGLTDAITGGDPLSAAVASRIHSPGFGGPASFHVTGKPEGTIATVNSHGPHLFRVTKTGNVLMMAVGEWKHGAFRAYGEKGLPSLTAAAPFLGKSPALYFAGTGTFLGVRLSVGGKVIDPGKPAPLPADVSKVPFVRLGGANPLPGFLKAEQPGTSDAGGLLLNGASYRTAGDTLLDKDFLLDLRFHFAEGERAIMTVGLGAFDNPRGTGIVRDTVYSRVHSPGFGGFASVSVSGIPDQTIGVYKTVGPNQFRLEKRGDTLTMTLGVVRDGAFEPFAARTIPRLTQIAPFLNRQNCTAFVNGGGTLEAVRFVVNGKPAPVGAAVVAVAPKSNTPGAVTAPKTNPPPAPGTVAAPPKADPPAATDAALPGKSHLFSVTTGKLPTYLHLTPDPRPGVKGHFIRTHAADFLNKDFTFDVLYRFVDGQNGIVMVGMGDGTTPPATGGFANMVGIRLHSRGLADGYAAINVSGRPEQTIGKVPSDGPHLFRLRKKGNVVTMALCVDFKDTFTPTFEQSLPDLKAAAPFLNDKNATLFATGGGAIESVRLAVAGEPVETRDLALNLPDRVVEGKATRLPAVKDAGAKGFAVAAGPKGLAVSAAGELAWTPTAAQLGRHEVRVKFARGKESLLVAREVEVVSAADAKAVGGDLAKVDSLYKLPLASEHFFLAPGFEGRSLLLLEGDRLRRLTGNGVTVQEDRKLPAKYERIVERADYFVGLSDEKKALHVIDKKSLAVRKSVRMDYLARTDLAPHPSKPLCYVCVQTGGEGPPHRILVVEEDTGDVLEPPGFFGNWAAVSPDGRELYAGYRETYRKGDRLLINPDRIHVISDYGTFDALLVYDITREKPVRKRMKDEPGGGGNGVVLSADGKRLSYLSYSGYPVQSGNIPGWNPSNLDKRPVSYPTRENDAPATGIAFHPVLELAATPGRGGAVCYDRESGEVRAGMVELAYPPMGGAKADRVFFAPDGAHLLLSCEEGGARFLRRARLTLTPAEAAKVKAARTD